MQRLFLLAKLAVSVGLLWYVLRDTDVVGITNDMLRMDVGWLLLSVLAMVGHVVTCFLRWQTIIYGLGRFMPLRRVVETYYVAMFANTFLPGTVGGDLLRMWYATKYGVPGQSAIHSVVFERVATVLGLLFLVSLGTPILSKLVPNDAFVFALNGATFVAIVGLVLLVLFNRIEGRWHNWKLGRLFREFSRDAERLFFVPGTSVRIMSVTMLSHVFSGLVIYALARAMALDLPLLPILALSMPVLLLAGLPISLAGWGVRESATVVAFALLGVSKEPALAVSIMFGILSVLVSLPGVIFWLRAPARES